MGRPPWGFVFNGVITFGTVKYLQPGRIPMGLAAEDQDRDALHRLYKPLGLQLVARSDMLSWHRVLLTRI